MLGRRKFLSFLAALPFAGLFVKKAVSAPILLEAKIMFVKGPGELLPEKTTDTEVFHMLQKAKKELAPYLWGVQRDRRDLEFDMSIDHQGNAIVVAAYCPKTQNFLGFAITYDSVVDNRYKEQFNPCMQALVRLVSGDAVSSKDSCYVVP